SQGGPNPGAANFQADWDQEYVDWLDNVRSAFVTDSTTMAGDDAQYQETVAGIGDDLANKVARMVKILERRRKRPETRVFRATVGRIFGRYGGCCDGLGRFPPAFGRPELTQARGADARKRRQSR